MNFYTEKCLFIQNEGNKYTIMYFVCVYQVFTCIIIRIRRIVSIKSIFFQNAYFHMYFTWEGSAADSAQYYAQVCTSVVSCSFRRACYDPHVCRFAVFHFTLLPLRNPWTCLLACHQRHTRAISTKRKSPACLGARTHRSQ